MSDDWQPGDLARCVTTGVIEEGDFIGRGTGLREGAIYCVKAVRSMISRHVYPPNSVMLLELENDVRQGRFACRFRKIRPHTPDEEDRETIRLLTGKREPVPA